MYSTTAANDVMCIGAEDDNERGDAREVREDGKTRETRAFCGVVNTPFCHISQSGKNNAALVTLVVDAAPHAGPVRAVSCLRDIEALSARTHRPA